MKKLLITKLFCLLMIASFAEGYQVNLLSARQTGMGHTGVALKLGAESMHFNPAGLVFMNKGFSFSGGMSGIFSKNGYNDGSKEWNTSNPMGTPVFFYAAYKPTDDLAFGLSFTTPYGSTLDWGEHWAGAHMVQDISLKAYYFQPTVSYKINDKLSIGAGAVIMAGSFELNKGLIARGYMEFLSGGVTAKTGGLIPNPFAGQYTDIVPASVNLKGDAEISYGFNIGLLYDATDWLSVGLSYRSKMSADVEGGSAKISYHDNAIEGYFTNVNSVLKGMGQPTLLPDLDQGTFSASLPMPANATIGVAVKANEKLTLSADIQFVEWSSYKESIFDFSPSDLDRADVTIAKDYSNTFIYRIGAEYLATEMITLRAGAYFDESPINNDYYNPETPGMDKLGLSIGSSITIFENFNVDMALLYIKGFDVDGTVKDPNTFVPNKDFAGEYTTSAIIPSIGLSYSF
jgi:long-chain fatty acid transport protein